MLVLLVYHVMSAIYGSTETIISACRRGHVCQKHMKHSENVILKTTFAALIKKDGTSFQVPAICVNPCITEVATSAS